MKINEYLSSKTYPGRGVLLGISPNGKYAVAAYFIMGRSENSRNRIFVPVGDDMKTEAFDPAKLKDPSLIIYYPVRKIDGKQIVTNGDQTDTVYEFIKEGKCFNQALKTRKFEPDAPNFTPRISGIQTDKTGAYKLSILKCSDGVGDKCARYTYDYAEPEAGFGHIIHTYVDDGNPIPSFVGEPVKIELTDDMEAFANDIWKSLNEENKVSLFVRYTEMETGKITTKIINKLG